MARGRPLDKYLRCLYLAKSYKITIGRRFLPTRKQAQKRVLLLLSSISLELIQYSIFPKLKIPDGSNVIGEDGRPFDVFTREPRWSGVSPPHFGTGGRVRLFLRQIWPQPRLCTKPACSWAITLSVSNFLTLTTWRVWRSSVAHNLQYQNDNKQVKRFGFSTSRLIFEQPGRDLSEAWKRLILLFVCGVASGQCGSGWTR